MNSIYDAITDAVAQRNIVYDAATKVVARNAQRPAVICAIEDRANQDVCVEVNRGVCMAVMFRHRVYDIAMTLGERIREEAYG
ncbi:MAG: hypothetical protein LBT97_03280 [Planctomycetota bacterium]|jgi:hypothetical protein|nr:hypothetical protein [Planctomycetota bacterium]